MSGKRQMAFILVSFPKGSRAFLDVISLISKFEHLLLGSIQVPIVDNDSSVFGLLAKATTDEIGAITGPLGKLHGVKVKSAILPSDD